ncbi:unnamed protein product [Spirodela intermedia]|uniref:Uncharacterized protein n=1 Tax=Spirodela intermedia TaxID=51605 RepID=A0A7I8J1A8_SPIIN|nr:unnamed protein product [Spirodela intermedia]CAA6663593.1 unnamed protein product [Spirodela intermedia]
MNVFGDPADDVIPVTLLEDQTIMEVQFLEILYFPSASASDTSSPLAARVCLPAGSEVGLRFPVFRHFHGNRFYTSRPSWYQLYECLASASDTASSPLSTTLRKMLNC